MKIRFIIYFVVLVIGVTLFLVISYPQSSFNVLKKIAPRFSCNLYSGKQSAQMDPERSNCVKNGCQVANVEGTHLTNCFDCDYYTFSCIPK